MKEQRLVEWGDEDVWTGCKQLLTFRHVLDEWINCSAATSLSDQLGCLMDQVNPQILICLTDTHKAIAAVDHHANYFPYCGYVHVSLVSS
jgi:hypothetical protein